MVWAWRKSMTKPPCRRRASRSSASADRTAIGRAAARTRAARREILGRAGDRHLEIVEDLLHDVELAQPVQASILVVDRLELGAVLPVHLADRVQPVVDKAASLAV